MAIDLTDVSDIIVEFGSPYTVTRAGAVEFDTIPGQPTQGTPSTFVVTAVVQPVSGRDLQRLPEGVRAESARAVFTRTALVLTPPDTLAAEGLTWQVESDEPWAAGGFYKYIVRKVG